MESEKVKIDGKEYQLFYFSNPMFHEDWHEAEKLGLKYVRFSQEGPDYWDDYLIFSKIEDYKIIKKYLEGSY